MNHSIPNPTPLPAAIGLIPPLRAALEAPATEHAEGEL